MLGLVWMVLAPAIILFLTTQAIEKIGAGVFHTPLHCGFCLLQKATKEQVLFLAIVPDPKVNFILPLRD